MKPFIKTLQKLRRFTLSLSLIVVLTSIATFGFGTPDSWAAALSPAPTAIAQSPVVALFGWGKAKAKQVEGQAQEMLGEATGDAQDQIMGKAKQAEGQLRGAAADVKDQLQPQGRAKAVTKNLEGKAQAARGRATGDLSDQVAGNAKQLESQARNAVEDIKEMVD